MQFVIYAMQLPLLSILYSSSDTVQDRDYFFDNYTRPRTPIACVIQRTRRGAAYLDDPQTRHIAQPGEAILFQHGEDTRYGIPEDSELPYENQWVCISGEAAPELLRGLISHTGRKLSMPDGSRASRLLQTIIEHYQQRSFEDRFHESTLAYTLLMACFRLSDTESTPLDIARQSQEYILSNYHRPFSQQDMAAHIGISREHISRRFKEAYGVSPGQYCCQFRMTRAKDLLSISYAPISEIARQCGFADANSFTRAFKQCYGISPREMKDRSSHTQNIQ
ncbi:AraC family transcriptional regulator [Coraliomargarita algicola]|uniref:AraC family transcriptional regulator n=1 Tax=Coraliomargarita algicola TaxID=3092156 RepID=A0ABZ0RNG0_9BACT|nr:AraC family transcriptional regulator [Coraliomargarita sp. J2-16]WPJ96457.1 AraC family transcriptional regulator [Coraliomargarita sp. J2-16]